MVQDLVKTTEGDSGHDLAHVMEVMKVAEREICLASHYEKQREDPKEVQIDSHLDWYSEMELDFVLPLYTYFERRHYKIFHLELVVQSHLLLQQE